MKKDHLAQELEFEVVTVNRRGEIIARNTHRAQQFTEDLGHGLVLAMVALPGGTFMMGSAERHGYDDEHPLHSVTVAPFFMGKYPVTQEQWKAVMGWLPPCRFKGARRPVDRVSWNDARKFCARLSKKVGSFPPNTSHLISAALPLVSSLIRPPGTTLLGFV